MGEFGSGRGAMKRTRGGRPLFREDSDEEGPMRPPMRADEDEGEDGGFVPTRKADDGEKGAAEEEEDDDLDAYMAQINKEAKKDASQRIHQRNPFEKEDDDDPVTSYMAFRKEKEEETARSAEEARKAEEEERSQESDGDEDDPERAARQKKSIEDIPGVDHASIAYQPFQRDFYEPHPKVAGLSAREIDEVRAEIGLKVSGSGRIPAPVQSFSELPSLGRTVLDAVKRHGYELPTEIQSQALPVALSGRDCVGIAKTGSGKTAAFVLPLLVHAMDQPHVGQSEGPIGLIVAPTRELAGQIAQEAKRFGKPLGIKVTLIVGGDPKFEQYKALRDGGAEIVVGTPGRLLDMIKMKACSFRRCTYLVLDEADRMFDMGFEPQVRSIIGQIRPDRQTLLFSATFKPNVEMLASAALTDPVRIVVGAVGAVNENVTQIVEVFGNEDQKFDWLIKNIPRMSEQGSIVIFVLTRGACAQVANKLRGAGLPTCSIHGETDQADREGMLRMFKRQEVNLLVATDIAARGLDIKHVKHVVNYEPAKNMDWHTHRIGRTGRAGEKGTAYTLLTPKNSSFAEQLVRSFQRSSVPVPPALAALANRRRGDRGFFPHQSGMHPGEGRGGFSAGADRQGRGGFSFRGGRGGRGGRDRGRPGGRGKVGFNFVRGGQ